MRDAAALPALLGGSPVRPAGPPDWPGNRPDVLAHLQPLLTSGGWGKYHGDECSRLITELRQLFHQDHVILCCSGTAAVELALHGCRVEAGDDVVMAGYDFPANFKNIVIVGGTPRLVDIGADDGQLDVDLALQAITPQTKAIIASHLHGGCVDVPRLTAEANQRGVLVIEDACQATGATLHDRPLGSWGNVSVLSFGGSKLLSAGRGGAVLTNRSDIAQRIKLYQQRGNEAYPLSELQAAVLVPQLRRLDEQHRRRAEWVAKLAASMSEESGLRLLANAGEKASPAYYKVGLWYDAAHWDGLTRDQFATAIRAEGFALFPGFRALHRCHARRRFQSVGPLLNSERADESLLVLHHPLLLEPLEIVEEFLAAIRKVRAHAGDLRDAPPSTNLETNHDE